MIKVHYLPGFAVATIYLGLITTYSLSVSLGHVYYLFPFISDTGAEPPESGIFGYTLNITIIFLLLSMYVRYQQVICVQDKLILQISPCWNIAAFNFGIVSCLGLNIVANFQENTSPLIHLCGAFVCLSCAICYLLIQTKISYYCVNQPYGISNLIFYIRLVCCLAMIPLFINVLWFGKLAADEFTGFQLNYWPPQYGGFTYRLISTFSEWFVVLALMIYIMTFCIEFRQIQCENISIHLKTD